MAKKNELWILMILATFVPFIGGIAFAGVLIWFFWIIAERIKFPGWTSLLLLIPIANLIILGIWVWAKN